MNSKFSTDITVLNKIGNTATFKAHTVSHTLVVPAVSTQITGVALGDTDSIVVYMPYKYLTSQGYTEPSLYKNDSKEFTFRVGDYIDTQAGTYPDSEPVSIAALKRLNRITGVQSFNFGKLAILVVTLQ